MSHRFFSRPSPGHDMALRRIARRTAHLLCLSIPLSLFAGGSPGAPRRAELPFLAEAPTQANRFGMNTCFLSDWDGGFAFVDAMKHARPWRDAKDWHRPVGGVDALGWPTADASTVIFTGTPEQINGTYRLVFNGQAKVAPMWAGGSVAHQTYDAATNTTTADVTFRLDSTGSCGLVFTATRRSADSPENTGFTQARLYRPGYPTDGSVVFTRPYLDALGKGRAVRTMDWTSTNTNLLQHWTDRVTPLHTTQGGLEGPPYVGPGGWNADHAFPSYLGVAIEHQIQLCNTLKADLWINVPVMADDDYVRNLALALRYGTDGTRPYTSPQENPAYPPLDPDLRVYVEYANEIWNSAQGFYGFPALRDLVGTLPTGHEVNTPPEPNIYYRMWRYPAYRMAAISTLFRSVYGNSSMMSRVRPVLMTQQGNAQETLSQALLWMEAYGQRQNPARLVKHYLFGAGGSGYYGVNHEPADKWDRDAYFAPGNYPATANVKGMGVDAVWAANYGLKRVAYEGGPTLDAFSDAQARALNADPRMQDMIVKTHDAWSAQGGNLLVYYTVRGAARWEFTPNVQNLDTPKFRALDQLHDQPRVPVSLGQAFPGTLVAVDWMGYQPRTGYGYRVTRDGVECLGGNDAGEWVAFPGHTSAPVSGTLGVKGLATKPTTIDVWINGVRKGQIAFPGGSHLADSTPLAVTLPAGLVAIRLQVLQGGLDVRSITIQ